MATYTYDLEHMGIDNGWEVDGDQIGYGPYPITGIKGDTIVLNFLGSDTSYAYRWRVSGITHANFSNLTQPTILGPANSDTGTATLTVNTGSVPADQDLDIINVRYQDSGGDALNDGDDNLSLYFYFYEGDEYFPDTDVNVSYNATPAISLTSSPNLLDADTTAFSVGITNGTANTVYEIREEDSQGTVLGSRTGTGTINLINHLPAKGAVKYYYLTARRPVANLGTNVPYPVVVTPFKRDAGDEAAGFEVFNASGTLILDQSKRIPHLAVSGSFETTETQTATYQQINITDYEPNDDWHALVGPTDIGWEPYWDEYWVQHYTGYIRIYYRTYFSGGKEISYWIYKK